MTFHIKKTGAWKEGVPYIKKSGAWKVADELWIKKSGVWKLAFQNVQQFSTAGGQEINIFVECGSPTEPGNFEWTLTADADTSSSGTYAVTTGAFPAGSTLKIINQAYIRGRGGKGGNGNQSSASTVGSPGHNALNLTMDVEIDNGAGHIWGGGGGGGGGYDVNGKTSCAMSGGGGAGDVIGSKGSTQGGSQQSLGSDGTATAGGNGGSWGYGNAGNGGGPGAAGTASTNCSAGNKAGGAAGKAVAENGYTATFLSGNDSTRVKGAVS